MFTVRNLLLSSAVVVAAKFGVVIAAEANHLAPITETSPYETKHRLGMADKQRALIEEMSEAACMIAKNIEVAYHQDLIRKLRDRYERVHKGLLEGDAELGLTGEEHFSKVLKAMAGVEELWETHRLSIDRVIETGAVSDADAHQLFEEDAKVLEGLHIVISAIEGAYANPAEMLLANAVMIDLAGRQEMLTQAIGKDVCLLNLGWEVVKHEESLKKEIALFEASHQALTHGMPAMGIKAAPTPEIKAALDAFMSNWEDLRPVIDRTLAGESVPDDELKHFSDRNIKLLDELDAIIAMYEKL